MNFPYVLPDGSFSCEKVCDSEECKRLLSTFEATCEAGKGLEKYLTRDAIIETRDHVSTTYIVFDRLHEMCGYFTLKTASCLVSSNFQKKAIWIFNLMKKLIAKVR